MLTWLLDTDKFIKINGLEPVTNPVMFDGGAIPTKDGLFSTEIFGMSVKDRKETFSYIELGIKFLNPKAYITLKRLNRNFEALIYGTKKFTIDDNGVLQPDENGQTGITFLYKNWEKIKFEKNDSRERSERVDMLTSNKKDTIFMDKLIIIPAFYRDVNIQTAGSSPKVPELNDLYAKIMRNVILLKQSNTFDFMLSAVVGKTQDLIVDIYNLFKEKLAKKEGYLRKYLMGKSVDYCARIVLSGTSYDKRKNGEQNVNFDKTGVPLSYCCSLFTPFIIWWLKRWFKREFEDRMNDYPIFHKNKYINVRLDDPRIYYNDEYIESRLERFINIPSSRFDLIELPISKDSCEKFDITEPKHVYINGLYYNLTTMETIDNVSRPMTWTDLLYMAAIDITADKHIVITRYPMLDYLGTMVSGITVLSTRLTKPMVINDKHYPNYPVIELDAKRDNLDALFKDTVNVCPLYLAGLDGDHDGDQITIKGVFSQEANEECERIMYQKSNLLTIEGSSIRKIGNEGIQTLYSMTKFRDIK